MSGELSSEFGESVHLTSRVTRGIWLLLACHVTQQRMSKREQAYLAEWREAPRTSSRINDT